MKASRAVRNHLRSRHVVAGAFALALAIVASVTTFAANTWRVPAQAGAYGAAPSAPAPTGPPGTTALVSGGGAGQQGNGASGGASVELAGANPDQAISADGRWVAFASTATNLIPGEQHPAGGIFLRDRQDDAIQAIPWTGGGVFPVGVVAAEPTISANGDVVAFTAIVSGGTAGVAVLRTTAPYVLVWDRLTGLTEVASLDGNNRPTPGFQPAISADGLHVAYSRWIPNAPTPSPTPSPTAANHAPLLFNLTASPTCLGGDIAQSTITVHASDPDLDPLSVRIQLSWTQPGTNNTFSRFPAAMAFAGGDSWTYVVSRDVVLNTYKWGYGNINYRVTAQDSKGVDSITLTDNPFAEPPNNFLTNVDGVCIIL